MANFDQTTGWIVFGAILLGAFIGGKVVLSIVQSSRPNDGYYNPGYRRYRPSERGNEGGYGWYVLLLFIIILSAILFFSFLNGKLPGGLLDKYFGNKNINENTYNSSVIEEAPMQSSPKPWEKKLDPAKIADEDHVNEPIIEEVTEEGVYIVQEDALSNWDNTERLMKELADAGAMPGYHISQNDAGVKIYHIFTGTYPTLEEAEVAKQQFHRKDALIREARGLELRYYYDGN